MTELPAIPAHVQPFIDVLGVDGTVEFLMAFGGAELSVQKNPHPNGKLAQAIGLNAAKALYDAAPPKRIPVAKPWIAQVLHAQGSTIAAIARKLHTTDVSVRRWIKQGRGSNSANAAQYRLF